jgi:hypothetical protein
MRWNKPERIVNAGQVGNPNHLNLLPDIYCHADPEVKNLFCNRLLERFWQRLDSSLRSEGQTQFSFWSWNESEGEESPLDLFSQITQAKTGLYTALSVST